MRRRVLLGAVVVFAVGAAPARASCLDALTWQGQMYTAKDERALAGAPLGDRARVPGPSDCGPVAISIGGKRPRPLSPDVMNWEVVHSIADVPPTVAVLRDGKVYRNSAPLKALPWGERLTG